MDNQSSQPDRSAALVDPVRDPLVVLLPPRPPHPNFWWALLWCFGFLSTQIGVQIAAMIVALVVKMVVDPSFAEALSARAGAVAKPLRNCSHRGAGLRDVLPGSRPSAVRPARLAPGDRAAMAAAHRVRSACHAPRARRAGDAGDAHHREPRPSLRQRVAAWIPVPGHGVENDREVPRGFRAGGILAGARDWRKN